MSKKMQVCPTCEQQIPLRFRRCGYCGTTLTETTAAPEIRRQGTIVTSDLKGSTALGERLDPESLRRVLARWHESMRTALERHGGTVEKFVGDAVMAVFGLPVAHEDDALRAARAAVDMRVALGAINAELGRDYGVEIEVRTALHT